LIWINGDFTEFANLIADKVPPRGDHCGRLDGMSGFRAMMQGIGGTVTFSQ
jgi:hypothetical protein